MNIFTKTLLAVAVCAFGIAAVPLAASATDSSLLYLASTAEQAKEGVSAVGGDDNTITLPEFLRSVINIMLYLIGVIAVIMIIIGGIKYVTSNGDSASISSAKNTILYAVIGVVVAILAFAIVNWIVDNIAAT